MKPTLTPQYPWQKISMDYCEIGNSTYLIVVDYYSSFPEIIQMPSMITRELISRAKGIFARFGVPEVVMSDSESQFTSQEWR